MAERYSRRKLSLLGSTVFGKTGGRGQFGIGLMLAGTMGALLAAAPQQAQALNLYNGLNYSNNLEINLSTTLSYTPIWRVQSPSQRLVGFGNANGSEGDLNFAHGLVSNQFEILPVLDIKDGNYGAHFSAEGYINTSYLTTNQNDQPQTLNPISLGKSTDFTSATRNVDGLNARVLDAFVYGTERFGAGDQQSFTLKVGRQTLLWGQSLFLTNNGIAAGMAPIDIITANDNPNAQTQQIIEPVGQVVATYQPNPIVTLQAYYQFEWAHDYFQGVGAYFNTTDILDKGGQSLILGPGFRVLRTKDLSPEHQNGQFGASLQLTLGNYDVGFYGLRYDSKAPTVYLPYVVYPGVGAVPTSYRLVYPRDIWMEGASVSTTIGPANVAAETSFRQHMNLTTGANFATPSNNANSNPAYPTGDTWAAQASALYVSPPIPFDPGGVSIDGEIGMNHVLKVTANNAAIDSYANHAVTRSSTAAQLQVVVTPSYYDVIPNLQLTFPVGLAYNFYGRSMVDPTENAGTGSVNIGVTATYRVTWIASVTYNDYIGAANPLMQGVPASADRSYVMLNFQHTF